MSLAIAMLLTACTSGGSSGPTPPSGIGTLPARPTQSPTPSPDGAVPPSPTPRGPTSGALSPGAAEDLVRYFLALVPYVYGTGDLADWKDLSHPECGYCASVTEGVEAQVANGGRVEGGAIEIREISSEPVDVDFVTVFVTARQDAATAYDEQGTVTREASAIDLDLAIAVEAIDNTWYIRALEVLEDAA